MTDKLILERECPCIQGSQYSFSVSVRKCTGMMIQRDCSIRVQGNRYRLIQWRSYRQILSARKGSVVRGFCALLKSYLFRKEANCWFLTMRRLQRNIVLRARHAFSSHALQGRPETKDWGLFPNEREGNVYSVNWSLTVDGITPVGDAYRNARIPTLAARLPSKIAGNAVELKAPLFTGEYKLLEAGDSISQDDFQEAKDAQMEHFESGLEMFVEDAGLGSHAASRVPSRLVTDNAATALIARALMVSTTILYLNYLFSASKFKCCTDSCAASCGRS